MKLRDEFKCVIFAILLFLGLYSICLCVDFIVTLLVQISP